MFTNVAILYDNSLAYTEINCTVLSVIGDNGLKETKEQLQEQKCRENLKRKKRETEQCEVLFLLLHLLYI